MGSTGKPGALAARSCVLVGNIDRLQPEAGRVSYTEFYKFLIPLYGLSLGMSTGQIGMLVGGGLPADKIESILSGLPTSFSDTCEQVVYEMATCLDKSRWVLKGLYDCAVEALGGITDVICRMGFYTNVSMTRASYDALAAATGMAR
jgi:hypothetical protein